MKVVWSSVCKNARNYLLKSLRYTFLVNLEAWKYEEAPIYFPGGRNEAWRYVAGVERCVKRAAGVLTRVQPKSEGA